MPLRLRAEYEERLLSLRLPDVDRALFVLNMIKLGAVPSVGLSEIEALAMLGSCTLDEARPRVEVLRTLFRVPGRALHHEALPTIVASLCGWDVARALAAVDAARAKGALVVRNKDPRAERWG